MKNQTLVQGVLLLQASISSRRLKGSGALTVLAATKVAAANHELSLEADATRATGGVKDEGGAWCAAVGGGRPLLESGSR